MYGLPNNVRVVPVMPVNILVFLDVPRFCEEQSQLGGRERRLACPPKNGIGPLSLGARIVRHNLCRCLQQSNTHSQTTINQRTKTSSYFKSHKRYQKQNRGTKNIVHNTQSDIITKLTQKLKYPTTPPYAQTESTNKEGALHTDQGRHIFHKHKHTQGHQHTQHKTTADQNAHRQDQRHHSSKHVLSTKQHDVTTLQHRGHRHRMLHTTRHQHTRLNTHM